MEELTDFLYEICSAYHLGIKDKDKFIDWIVVNAGKLYYKYEIVPNQIGKNPPPPSKMDS